MRYPSEAAGRGLLAVRAGPWYITGISHHPPPLRAGGSVLLWIYRSSGYVHMAGKRKRLLITPSDEVWALIDEVHQLTGTPKAAIVSELLDEIAPVFQNTIHALRIVEEQPREAQRLIQNFANESLGKLAQASLDLDAALDARTVKGKRARRRASAGAS